MSGGEKVAQECACSSDICRSQGCQIVAAAARNVLNASASEPTPDPLLLPALEALRTIRDRKWDTMTEGCDAASDAAKLARAILAQAKERGL